MKHTLLSLLMALLPLAASADAVEIGGIYYNLTQERQVAEVINNPGGYTGVVIIPESVEFEGKTYAVTSIGNEAFVGCVGLASVTIPNSVTSLGNGAFLYCYGLTSVTIGNSVTKIGNSAFYGCSNLTSVTIGNSVTTLGEYAFEGCKSLTSIEIPYGVTSIKNNAFSACTSLSSIIVSKSALATMNI